MIINHNISSMYASRQLNNVDALVQKNIEKVSSGMRINTAGDDASGLAVSEKMRAQIRGLNQAQRNTMDGVSLIQSAEGYLQETTDILQRLRELSVQAANGIYSDEDRTMIQVEVSQLVSEIDRIASHAEFNGMNLFRGDFAEREDSVRKMSIHFGANIDQRMNIFIGTMTSSALALTNSSDGGQNSSATGQVPAVVNNGTGDMINVLTVDDANKTIGSVDAALKRVVKQRVDLGAYQNRLEETHKGIAIAAENMQAAESRIRDTDIAKEMTDYVKNNILQQTSTAMLSQANIRPQYVLQLL